MTRRKRISASRIWKRPRKCEEEKFEPVDNQGAAERHCRVHQVRRDEPREKSPAAHPPGKKNPQGSRHQRRDARNARRRDSKTASWRNSTSSAPPRSASSAASSRAKSATSKTASRPRSWTSASRKTRSCIIGTSCPTSSTAAWKSSSAKAAARPAPKSRRSDIPRLYPPGAKSSCRSPKARSAPKARASRPIWFCPDVISSCCRTPTSPASRARLKTRRSASGSRKSCANWQFPTAWASSCARRAKASAGRISSATSPCCSRNGAAFRSKIQKQPMATCVFQEPDLIERTVRDFLTEDVERIVVDNHKAHDRMRRMMLKIKARCVGAKGQALRRGAADFRPVQRQQAIGKHLLAPGAFEERRLHRH